MHTEESEKREWHASDGWSKSKYGFLRNIHERHHANSETLKIYKMTLKAKTTNKNLYKLLVKDNLEEFTLKK